MKLLHAVALLASLMHVRVEPQAYEAQLHSALLPLASRRERAL